MLIVFGFKTVFRVLPGRMLACRYCGITALQHLEERANKFTLFFIPVFTTSRSYQMVCSNCGGSTSLSRDELKAIG